MNVNQIANEALKLDSKNRAVLAETLWKSLGDPYLVSISLPDENLIDLAIERDEEINNGEVDSITQEQLMNRLRGNEG